MTHRTQTVDLPEQAVAAILEAVNGLGFDDLSGLTLSLDLVYTDEDSDIVDPVGVRLEARYRTMALAA